jgi:hypothetical protein
MAVVIQPFGAIVIDMLPTEGCPCYGCSQRRRNARRVK